MEIHPILDPLALHRDSNYRYEFIKTGQSAGDNGNWSLIIIGDNLHVQVKIAGTWRNAWHFPRPK